MLHLLVWVSIHEERDGVTKKVPARGLTPQQRRVLDFITGALGGGGRPPSLNEIRDHLGLSATSTVHEHVTHLIAKGYLSREWNLPRSIQLTEPLGRQRSFCVVPHAGRVMAGRRLQRTPGPEEVAVPAAFGGDVYAVTVGDGALKPQGLFKDDMLIIAKPQSTGRQRALVMLEDKRGAIHIRRLTGDARAASGDASAIGVIVGLIRKNP